MENLDGSSPRKLPPEEELKHFKAVVRNVMMDAYREEAMQVLDS